MKNLICSGIWFVQIASVLLSIDRILTAPAHLKGDEYLLSKLPMKDCLCGKSLLAKCCAEFSEETKVLLLLSGDALSFSLVPRSLNVTVPKLSVTGFRAQQESV